MKAKEKPISKKKTIILITLFLGLFYFSLEYYVSIPRYRTKHFCKRVENDAMLINAGVKDYLSDPNHNDVSPEQLIAYEELYADLKNSWTITKSGDEYLIQVTDSSGQCPATYQERFPEWDSSIYTIRMHID